MRRPQTGCHDDEIVIQGGLPPVGQMPEVTGWSYRIRHLHFESLGGEKACKPGPHTTGAADHQRPPTTAPTLRRHPLTLLRRKRVLDEKSHYLLADFGRDPELSSAGARAFDDLLLLREIT